MEQDLYYYEVHYFEEYEQKYHNDKGFTMATTLKEAIKNIESCYGKDEIEELKVKRVDCGALAYPMSSFVVPKFEIYSVEEEKEKA